MPSVVPNFEYDIFISYRHKDNKGGHWVTEFVSTLKTELEATFKEDISIYFDENPHDGLLETHDVDDSLKDKLRCLIFIPIISQTYCDPKSFAWTNEFVVFKKIASEDQFGLKVKLSNGNVTSRILPVKIHDLTALDQKLVEHEIGPIRGIEFIFKAMGVNRPLTPTDNPEKNLNHTFYKDQVNKVANSAREIIFSLTNDELNNETESSKAGVASNERVKSILSKLKIRKSKLWRGKISWILVTVLLTVMAAWGWLRLLVIDKTESLPNYSFIPTEEPIYTYNGPGQNPNFSISPDGQSVVYLQTQAILIHKLNDFKAATLINGTQGSENPVFSPDGKFVAYTQNGTLKKIELQTGIATKITPASGGISKFWGSDNRIYFDSGLGSGGIKSVSDGGGKPEQVTQVNDKLGEVAHQWPQLIPDSKILIFTALGASGGSEDSKIVAQRLGSNEPITLVEKAIFGRYLSTGDLLYATNNGHIFLVPFDTDKLEITGTPKVVLSDVQTGIWGGAAYLSVSETGNLVYVPRNERPAISLLIKSGDSDKIDSQSNFLDSIISKQVGFVWYDLSISPVGRSALVTGRTYGTNDIWLVDLTSGASERLTFALAEDEYPVWSPKGKFLVYATANTGNSRRLYIKEVLGGKDPILLRTWPRHIHFSSWSQDSLYLAAYDFSASSMDVWAISVDGKDSIAVARSDADEANGVFSHDGKWLAYNSNESGIEEIYVVSFPTLAVKKQISVGGGRLPRWNQEAIFFLQGNHLVRQKVETRSGLVLGKLDVLFETTAFHFDISPDGKIFYLLEQNKTKDHQPLHLITNWFEDIKIKSKER